MLQSKYDISGGHGDQADELSPVRPLPGDHPEWSGALGLSDAGVIEVWARVIERDGFEVPPGFVKSQRSRPQKKGRLAAHKRSCRAAAPESKVEAA